MYGGSQDGEHDYTACRLDNIRGSGTGWLGHSQASVIVTYTLIGWTIAEAVILDGWMIVKAVVLTFMIDGWMIANTVMLDGWMIAKAVVVIFMLAGWKIAKAVMLEGWTIAIAEAVWVILVLKRWIQG